MTKRNLKSLKLTYMKNILTLTLIVLSLVACNNSKKSKKTEQSPDLQQHVQKDKPVNLNIDHKAYKMKGMLIAKNTFRIFKGKIESVGSKKGLPAVVDFCHDNAMKLADSLGKTHNVIIKRTSHKLRNPKNKPDADEQAVIDNYLVKQEKQERMEPVIMTDGEGYVHFYAPIKLKDKCLQCHGQPGKDIHEEVYKVIRAKYPNDKATGFKTGELRGIWDIKFLDKK